MSPLFTGQSRATPQLRHSIAHSLGLASYNTVNREYFVFKIFRAII